VRGFAGFSISICLLLSSCGNYKLVGSLSRYGNITDKHPWKSYGESYSPQNEIDELAIIAAKKNMKIREGNQVAVNVFNNKQYSYVATYEDKSFSENKYDIKEITYYLIVSEKILATRGPIYEPFPDELFERSVHICANNAILEGGSSTLFVTGWVQPVMLKADVASQCDIEVVARRVERDGPGEMLCNKTINICIPVYADNNVRPLR
jgi:hypothetical protein